MEYHHFSQFFSAIGTPTYKLAKFCEQLLKPLTNNEYKIKTSFSFAKEVLEFHASLFMASFDIKSLFTNIPLTETLNLCVQNLYRNQTHVGNLTQSSFYSLLKITMFESFFIFGGKFYVQCDGVAMGSHLGPTLANVFMRHFENMWLRKSVLPIINQLFTEDSLMIHFYSFKQKIMFKSLKIISISNTKTQNLHRKLRKMVHCHFWI